MKDLDVAQKILEVDLVRDRKNGIISLTQQKYIRRVLERFEMGNFKLVQTPVLAHFRLSCQQYPKTDAEKVEMISILYSNTVGCLMYAVVLTRLDLSYAMSVVSNI